MVPSATALALCLALLLACLTRGESLVLVSISLLAGAEPRGSGWAPWEGGADREGVGATAWTPWLLSPRISALEQGRARAPCSSLAFHCWLGAQRLSEGHQPGLSALVRPRGAVATGDTVLGWVFASRQQLPGKPARERWQMLPVRLFCLVTIPRSGKRCEKVWFHPGSR